MANKKILKWKIDSVAMLNIIKERGYSINELGKEERIGYSDRQIRKYLKEGAMPPAMVQSICDVLDASYGLCYSGVITFRNAEYALPDDWIPVKAADGYPREEHAIY